jgi:predicted Zn-dependent peptidase
MPVREVPDLQPSPETTLPPALDRRLSNGMRVLAVHRPGIPLVELRLRIPLGEVPIEGDAVARLVAGTMLAGTGRLDRVAIADRIETLGASLDIRVDADQLLGVGVVLVENLAALLDLLAEVLLDARYPDAEVDAECERLIQKVRMTRSRAAVQAQETLFRHLFGTHPYGRLLPRVGDLEVAGAAAVRAFHRRCVIPAGSALVMVGDVPSDVAMELAERAFGDWRRDDPPAPEPPGLPRGVTDPSLLVHRAGSVQSTIRIGGAALRRDDPRFPALQVANLLYGGYFSSRLVANIREDKGYTYMPRSVIEHGAAGSTLLVQADVATEVTAPALLEMWYELGRMSTLEPTPQELADVRQYATGLQAFMVSSQSGLASTLAELIGCGLDLTWIPEYFSRLASVTANDIYDIGVRVMAPRLLAVVVIGDASVTAEPLKAFGPWEVRRS